MAVSDDALLLRKWMAKRDADAFAEVVSRHSGMVYATCLRILRNTSQAEDAAQECFMELARVRTSIRSSLGGWLHTVAVRRSLDLLRAETRRRRRETKFVEETTMNAEPTWNDIQKHLDEAIAALPDKLREPIMYRFLEGQTHNAIAQHLGVSDSTVQYRLNRGIEQIRRFLKRRGVVASTGVLASLMASHLAAEAAPATLTVALGKLALAGAAGAVGGATVTSITGSVVAGGIITMNKLIVGGAVILVGGVAALMVTQKRPHERIRPAHQTIATDTIRKTPEPAVSPSVVKERAQGEASAPPSTGKHQDQSVDKWKWLAEDEEKARANWALRGKKPNRERAKLLFQPSGTTNRIFAYATDTEFLSLYEDSQLHYPDSPLHKSRVAWVDTAGRTIKTMTPTDVSVGPAAYVSKLGAVVYMACADDKTKDICVMDNEGNLNTLRHLEPNECVYGLAASPDSSEIVYMLATRGQNQKRDSLVWTDIESGETRSLGDFPDMDRGLRQTVCWGPGRDEVTCQVWSQLQKGSLTPTENRLMVVSTGESAEPYEVFPEITASMQSHYKQCRYESFAWSPDGSSFAFVPSIPPEDDYLYVARKGGSDCRRMTFDPVWGGIVWAPAGGRIAFSAARREVFELQSYEIEFSPWADE